MIHFLDSIKLRFRKDRQLYADLYAILGFYPRNIAYYKQALSHSSIREKSDNGQAINNERLEFLGDAIIEAVVSDIVFRRYTKKREGFLTTTRSKVVQRETLNKLAVELNLHKLIHAAVNNEEQHNSSMAGNAFEALIGAVYLDRGFAASQWFICNRIIGHHIDLDALAYKETNFKSKLLEWSQKNRVKVEFAIEKIEREGTDNPVFWTVVYLEGLKISTAKGFSKKESHQLAAKDALQRLRREPQLIRTILKRKNAGENETEAAPEVAVQAEELKKRRRRRGGSTAPVEAAAEPTAVSDTQPQSEKPEKTANEELTAEPKAASAAAKRRKRRKKTAAENTAPDVNDEEKTVDPHKESIVQAAEEAAFMQNDMK